MNWWKKCFVSINEESLKIESILGKNISDYFINETFLSIKTTNINYFFASKIIQLSNSFNIKYNSIIDKNNKINTILNDINELIEKYEISIDELIKSLIENIKSNIGYEIISLRNHYYDNLLFLYDLLITNYFFVSKQIEMFLSTFKNNLKLINFLEKLTICFNAKNYFVYSLFSNRQIKEKSSNFSNYGTLFTLEKNSFNLNLIKNFLFLLGNNEEVMNEYLFSHSNKLIMKIDLLLPIIKYLEN